MVIRMMVEKKVALQEVDAVEGLALIGGDEPVEAVAVGHPLHQFAGGHKRGIHRHGQGEAGQGRHDDAERERR